MKNKKGFTLVELLAVIVILAVIMLIAVPVISNLIQKNKEKAYEAKMELILKQAKLYAKDNKILYSSTKRDGIYVCEKVTVQQLLTAGYLEKEDDISSGKNDILDPRDGSSMLTKSIEVYIKSEASSSDANYQDEGIYIGNMYSTDQNTSNCH